MRIRAQDTLAWRAFYRAANYVLSSKSRTRVVINLILSVIAIRVYVDQGFDGWFADIVSFSIAWAGLDKLAEWLRKRWFPEAQPQQKDGSAGKRPN